MSTSIRGILRHFFADLKDSSFSSSSILIPMSTPAATKATKPKAPHPTGGNKCTTVKDVSSASFIAAYAAHLKRTNWLKLPTWVDLVKTGKAKELAPIDPDWYYIRAASIARRIYLHGGLGVGKFQKIYGGSNKRRGLRPCRFEEASGSILRHVIKQLEAIGVVEKHPGKKGGRRISQDGQQDLDRIAGRVLLRSIKA